MAEVEGDGAAGGSPASAAGIEGSRLAGGTRAAGDGAGAGLGDGTRAVRAGVPDAVQGEPFLPGPTFASAYHLAGDVTDARHGGYGRYGNPTWTALEAALAELEGGGEIASTVFPSGSAAIAAVLFSLLRSGDTIVVPSDGYPTGRTLGADRLRALGVETRPAPTDTAALVEAAAGAALVLVETPSNPGLDVAGIREVADAVHAAGGRLAVDNTLATPLGQRPLDLGADISLISVTKHLVGHSDVLLGAVATRDPEIRDALSRWRAIGGAIPGPFEAWLAHRSLATLDVRLERACANALALAELLRARVGDGRVHAVRYPGLPDDPAHAEAARQMTRFGTVLTFDLGTAECAEGFFAAATLIAESTSFGGVHTMAERRARWGMDDISPGLIRLSTGIENPADLIADVTAALDAAG